MTTVGKQEVFFPPYSFDMVRRRGRMFLALDDVRDWLAMVEVICRTADSADATELASALQRFLGEVVPK